MQKRVIKYSSIGQYRNLVKDIQHFYDGVLPKVKMTGSVKIHGTNASVVLPAVGEPYAQSRSNIITPEKDNSGFAAWFETERRFFDLIVAGYLREVLDIRDDHDVVIYGEWAGKGIQRGVAVSEVPKFFYVFGVKVVTEEPNDDGDDNHYWVEDYPNFSNGHDIIDARHIWRHEIEIDFNSPQSIQNELIKITEEIEKECPVGKHFGVSGVGEGVVWKFHTEDGKQFICKVKGEKHSVSKVKKLAEVDTVKLNSINEFVEYSATDNRMEQGFQEACNGDADRKLIGTFIGWVNKDIHKEESDTLESNGLTMKDVGSAISKKARNWFFQKEQN